MSEKEPLTSRSSVNRPIDEVVVHDVIISDGGRLSVWGKLAYGVGHVFNDMCASMWFTYLVLFYHKVVLLDNLYAGMLILIGQVADAAATPIIGFLCDMTHVRYGRRKLWHLIGTIMVAVSLFFIWHTCLPCQILSSRRSSNTTINSTTGVGKPDPDPTPLAAKLVYFAVPIVIFQFGWASVQISHLSLIPELTPNQSERVGLNSIRYAFTILANIGVYVAMLLLLEFVSTGGRNGSPDRDTAKLTSFNVWAYHNPAPSQNGLLGDDDSRTSDIRSGDVWIFSGTALGIIFFGILFSLIFQIGTREPYFTPEQRKQDEQKSKKLKWYLWFIKPQFYLVAVIYMCTRLMNNIVQAYIPLFLLDSLALPRTSVAIGPLVLFVSGFLMNMLMRFLNRVIGSYMVYFLGLALMAGGLLWYMGTQKADAIDHYAVYGGMILVGAGGATVLVTSLSMVADLIGTSTGSSAFVYGLMSFTDKLSSGIAIQVIQALHPCKSYPYCCPKCAEFYQNVLVYVPGGAVVLSAFALGILVLMVRWEAITRCCSNCYRRGTASYTNPRTPRLASPPVPIAKGKPTYSEVRNPSPMDTPVQNLGESDRRPLLRHQ